MSWLHLPEVDEVTCVHVACVDWRGQQGPCQYAPQPPAIGPELPEVLLDAEGGYWARHDGQAYYLRKPDGGYEIATWSTVRPRLDGADPRPPAFGYRYDCIPAGPLVVHHPAPLAEALA